MKKLVHILLLAFAVYAWIPTFAQQWENGNYMLSEGYRSEINSSNPFCFKSCAVHTQLSANLNSTGEIQTSYPYLNLHSADSYGKEFCQRLHALMFTTTLHEISPRTYFNIVKFIADAGRIHYTPSVSAKLTRIMHYPHMDASSSTRHDIGDLFLQEQPEIRKFALAIPFGVGITYNIRGLWSLDEVLGYQTAFNDNKDFCANNHQKSSHYPPGYTQQYNALSRFWQESIVYTDINNIAMYEGKPRGHSRSDDGYLTEGFTLTDAFIDGNC